MLGGISIWQLVIILAIVLLLFGSKKLRNIGGDLGNAVKGFKSAVKEEGTDKPSPQLAAEEVQTVDEGTDHIQAANTAESVDKKPE